MDQHDELWIIPCKSNLTTDTVKQITQFVDKGKGVWVFGGNTNKPANQILEQLEGKLSFTSGLPKSNGGKQVAGAATTAGQFGPHLTTTGLNVLDMEGAACKINGDFSSKEYTKITTGTDGSTMIVAYQNQNGGRMILDCYRERLFNTKQILSNQRFLKNGAAWLSFSQKFGQTSALAMFANDYDDSNRSCVYKRR